MDKQRRDLIQKFNNKIQNNVSFKKEKIKLLKDIKQELEQYYKKFRDDLTEVAATMKSSDTSKDDPDGTIVDSKKLNDLMSEAMKKKKN